MKQRELTIPTVLGLLVAIGGLVSGLWLSGNKTTLGIFASGEQTAENVRVTNVSDTSLVASWTTSKATSGFVKFSENKLAAVELVVSDDRDQDKGTVGNYFTHFVTLRGLKPTTAYKLKIGSAEQIVTTGVTLRNTPAADVVFGQAVTAGGDPAEGAIVYVQLPGAVTQASLVKASGSWVVPLSLSRSSDLTSFAAYDKQTEKISVTVQAGPLGTTTLSTPLANARPMTSITLGQTTVAQVESQPALPTPTPSSKFTSSALTEIASVSSKLKINSIKPEVTGVAPANAVLTIEVHSDNQITATVKADKNGNFVYKIPPGLEPGEHTITISTLVNGVVQKLTKTFVVEAAGTTGVVTFTATPSAKVRVAYPATTSAIPKSGNLTPTLILLILGIGLVTLGVVGLKINYLKLKIV
jgi:hypothetical protein